MARIRTVKPEFFTSLTIASLTVEARLTFIGLWTHSDDEGRCVDDTRLIRAALWPLDDRSFGDVEKDLSALADASLIVRYQVSGKRFLAVAGWSEHQKINRPSKSRLPPPPHRPEPPPTSVNSGFTEGSLHPHGDDTEDSLGERKGKEQGTGKGTNGSSTYLGHPRQDHDVEPPPSDAGPTLVEELITEFRDNSPRGVPSKLAEQLAGEIRRLERDGFTRDEIREGLGLLRVRRLGAGSLPNLVDEVANAQPSNVVALPMSGRNAAPNGRRPSATDRAVGEAMEVLAHFEALEQAEQARKEITP